MKQIEKVEVVHDTGYGLVPRSIMRNPELSFQAKAIYSYLASFAGNTGKAFPSTDLMSRELNMARNTLFKYLKELKVKEVITVERERTEEGTFDRNIYCLHNKVKKIPCTNLPYMANPDMVNPYTVNEDTNSNNSNSNKLNSNKMIIGGYINNFTDEYTLLTGKDISSSSIEKLKLLDKKMLDQILEEIKKSNYLRTNAEINWILHNKEKIIEGKYRDFKKSEVKNKFNNFKQLSETYDEDYLENIAKKKREKLYDILEN